MKTQISFLVSAILLAIFFLVSCEKDDDPKKENFNSPEEYLENPSVENAMNESNIPIYHGDTPPVLSGVYNVAGSVTDASLDIRPYLYGLPINSTITLYNQTASGEIDLKEQAQGITVYGRGGYIIGENGYFSIFQESLQTGEGAGLPSDVSVTVVVIMSGKKYDNGDLTAEGISIITNVDCSDPEEYNIESLEKTWWMWEAYFTLEGPAKKSICLERQFSFPDEIRRLFQISN